MRRVLVITLVASACGFTPGALPNDATVTPDGPPAITVGFPSDTGTLTDENQTNLSVRVVLSKPADEAVTVAFAVTGGTANRPSDYLLNDGTLTFAVGDVEETIDITIGADGMEEPDETILLELSSPSAAVLGIDMHTVTISANVLPRVTFSVATTALDEPMSPTINAVLDVASPLTTSVEVAVVAGGSATGGGVDYTLNTTTVTFNPNQTTVPVDLAVATDTMDEPNEDVTLQLQNPVNVIVGTQATTMHTINDEDVAETVQFTVASTQVRENAGTVMIEVSLGEVSGKSFTIPFSVDGSSTAMGGGTDYTLVTASPLSFPAGTLTQTIQITVNDDTMVEANETVVLTLGTPTPMPNATVGTNATHTLTIMDNDTACVGAGATQLCFPAPAQPVTVSGPLDTDTSVLCSATGPSSGWTGGPASCFVLGTDITVQATQVTGSRPLVLFASGTISITGTLDAAGHVGAAAGPGAGIGCSPYSDFPLDSTSGGGGGAGGTFRTQGGDGGEGNGANNSEGSALAVGAVPTTLRGGCAGQTGGDGNGNNGGTAGPGGGSVYLAAAGMLTIASGVTVNVSGGGGQAKASPNGGLFAGGGGGGSGGMLMIHAMSLTVSGANLMANGGGGSAGADNDSIGTSGGDPSATSPGAGGSGGSGMFAGGNGGRGFGNSTTVQSGSNGISNEGGGGGGGGGGYILSNLALTGANTVSAGDIDIVP